MMFIKNKYFSILLVTTGLLISTANSSIAANKNKNNTDELTIVDLLAQAQVYQVKLGDTLSGISDKVGLSIEQLIAFNPQLRYRQNLIYIGETLKLSQNIAPAPNSTFTNSQDRVINPVSVKPIQPRRSTVFANLPDLRRNSSSTIGAKRGVVQGCTQNENETLKAILPATNFGWTLYDYPSFSWYFPELKSQNSNVVFLLGKVEREAIEGKVLETFAEFPYETELQVASSGMINFTLPSDAPPLEEGQEYEWEIQVYCSSGDTMSVKGRIQRLSTNNPQLSQQLEQAEITNYPAILADAGIWYDAIHMMARLLQENPRDLILRQDWENVLRSIDLEDQIDAPLKNIQAIKE